MKHGEALKLLPDDVVYWTDTDDGGIVYRIKIRSIEAIDDRFHISGEDGPNSVVHFECHPEELSPAGEYRVRLTRTDVTYATVDVVALSSQDAERLVEAKLQDLDFEPEEETQDVKLGGWTVDWALPVEKD